MPRIIPTLTKSFFNNKQINGVLGQVYPENTNREADIVCVVFIFVYALGYSMGFGPAAWVYGSEVILRSSSLFLFLSLPLSSSLFLSRPLSSSLFLSLPLSSSLFLSLPRPHYAPLPLSLHLYAISPQTPKREKES